MTRLPVTVAPHTLLEHAERLATALGIHHLLVTDEDCRLLGVFCRCDLRYADAGACAAELMHAPPYTIDPVAPADEAIDAMIEVAVGCLPVLAGEELVGVVTRGDLRRAGLLDAESALTRRCASCGARHHLSGTAPVSFCLDCVERGRAFDVDDPYGEIGGEG